MKIENLPKKVLNYIIKKLKKEYDDTSFNDIHDVYEHRSVMGDIDSIVKPFGIKIDYHYQFGFFWLLYLNNKDKEEGEELVLPVKRKLTFDVDVDVRKYATETYTNEMFTYSDNGGYNQSMIHSDDNWSYYDGEFIDDDVYDSESNDWEIKHLLISPLNESVRKRKIITEDKKRKLEILLKQKEYIENEIRKITT
jgi:hypothetical protein